MSSAKQNILGILINETDLEESTSHILNAARERSPLSVSALAVHGVMTGVLSPEQRYRLNHFDLLLADGQPIRWALNILYRTGLKERVYGPDLMLRLCQQLEHEQLPVYLYGNKEETLALLIKNLKTHFPNLKIAGQCPSRFGKVSEKEQETILAEVRKTEPAIIFVGLGCPRQEVWIYENVSALGLPLVGVGAAFDFHAKKLKRAPSWMQRWGLEWFFRLVVEPKRLWRRYLFLNPYFLILLALQVLHIKTLEPNDSHRPEKPLRYA